MDNYFEIFTDGILFTFKRIGSVFRVEMWKGSFALGSYILEEETLLMNMKNVTSLKVA